MKHLFVVLLCVSLTGYGQLSMDSAKIVIAKYRLGYSTYFEPFLAHAGYGAPWILSSDGGASAFGDNMLYKFDKTGKEEWKRTVKSQFDEMESQCVAEDTKGNFYVSCFLMMKSGTGADRSAWFATIRRGNYYGIKPLVLIPW